MKRKTHLLVIGLVCLALLLTSCKRLRGVEPTARPTLTPTPRSTPLPPLPTPLPLGSEDNPIHMAIVLPSGSQREVESAADDFRQALLDDTQLVVAIDRVASDAEALAALCDSPAGTVSVAWLSGLAYAAAYAQDCGTAALQVQRGERSSGTTGDEALIIVHAGADIQTGADLANRSFCRLAYADPYSWLLPSMMIQFDGLESLTDLSAVRDYDDAADMIDDVASGDCDAAGIAASQFDDLISDSTRSRVRTLETSETIPYLVLVLPAQLPLGQQQALRSALIAIGNGTRADVIKPLLEQDQLVPVTDNELSGLRSFISRVGIDLAQAGT